VTFICLRCTLLTQISRSQYASSICTSINNNNNNQSIK
jgi:hypothetical protein